MRRTKPQTLIQFLGRNYFHCLQHAVECSAMWGNTFATLLTYSSGKSLQACQVSKIYSHYQGYSFESCLTALALCHLQDFWWTDSLKPCLLSILICTSLFLISTSIFLMLWWVRRTADQKKRQQLKLTTTHREYRLGCTKGDDPIDWKVL